MRPQVDNSVPVTAALSIHEPRRQPDAEANITKALWNKESRKLMDVGHAKGKTITPETALSGVGVPLHPGAEKFYKEAGLLK